MPIVVIFIWTPLSIKWFVETLLWHVDAVLGSGRPFHYDRPEYAPNARSMQHRGGGMVCYNVQAAVDTQHHLIVSHEGDDGGK